MLISDSQVQHTLEKGFWGWRLAEKDTEKDMHRVKLEMKLQDYVRLLDWNKNTRHNEIGPDIQADGDEVVLAGAEGGMLLPRHT